MDQLKHFGALIQRLITGESLTRDETRDAFCQILADAQPDLQQGAFLAALTAKGETADELAGAWEAIDANDTVHVSGHYPELADNSGTGMDELKTFNVSTAAAVVAAACQVPMARHGARALTSLCGTVDMAEQLGIDVEADIGLAEKSLQDCGLGLFNGHSPQIHPGALARILSQIRFGSTLNIAASLANPARPQIGVRGVYRPELLHKVAALMRQIGYRRGIVVHGHDDASGKGMDEFSVCGMSSVVEFNDLGVVDEYRLTPEDIGVKRTSFAKIAASSDMPTECRRFVAMFDDCEKEPELVDFTAVNAAAILYLAGKAESLHTGVIAAKNALANGSARAQLKAWVTAQSLCPEKSLAKLTCWSTARSFAHA